jgi:hypothetical protein
MGNISMSGPVMLKLLAASVFGISCFVFIIWLINIAILNYFYKRSFVAEKTKRRYLWSFLVCLGLMFSLRLSLTPLMNDPERVQSMLNWKIKEFGLQIGSVDYTQYTNPIFQTAVIFFTVVSINAIVLIILDLVLLRDKKTKIEKRDSYPSTDGIMQEVVKQAFAQSYRNYKVRLFSIYQHFINFKVVLYKNTAYIYIHF